jgi:hypothetical protein
MQTVLLVWKRRFSSSGNEIGTLDSAAGEGAVSFEDLEPPVRRLPCPQHAPR